MREISSFTLMLVVLAGTLLLAGCSQEGPITPALQTPTALPAVAPSGPSIAAMVAAVERAFEYARDHGKEAAIKAFNDPSGPFVQGDPYIFAYDLNGTTLALPFQPDLIGTNRIDMKDPDGVPFIRELIRAACDGGGFVYYRYPNPAQNYTVQRKISYAMQGGPDWILGSGVYEELDISGRVTTKF
ncbi:MAG: cache domain-containing protein [Methanomicrobiales archaeon]|nr:cache domain-containing protein [Methanomicrobiales archaeon]